MFQNYLLPLQIKFPSIKSSAWACFTVQSSGCLVISDWSPCSDLSLSFVALHFILYTLHFALYTFTLHFTLNIIHLKLYISHLTTYTLHLTLYTLHHSLCIIHYALNTLQSVQWTDMIFVEETNWQGTQNRGWKWCSRWTNRYQE